MGAEVEIELEFEVTWYGGPVIGQKDQRVAPPGSFVATA